MRGEKTRGNRENETPSFANNRRPIDLHEQSYHYIPIDYVRLEVVGISPDQFFANKKLNFTPVLIFDEIVKYESKHRGLKLEIWMNKKQRVVLSGSFHKFMNHGLHNYNDFNFESFNRVVREIESIYNIKPEQLKILCLEFGVNIEIPIPVRQVLDNCLQHKGKDIEIRISNDKGKYHQAEHDRTIFKLYDKGKQYNLPNINLMRVEDKVTNWTEYRSKGIVTLKDFIECDKSIFIEKLVRDWNEIIFYDVTASIPDSFKKYSNKNYWRHIKDTKSRTTLKRHKDRLKALNEATGMNIQKVINDLIIEKTQSLQGVTNSTFNRELSHQIKKAERKCLITGISIENQRGDSFLLSHTGLKELKEQNPDEFNRIRFKYLTGKWIYSSEEVQIREIAHNIRNAYFNLIHREERINTTGQLRLMVA